METYLHDVGQQFSHLPEVYQIELTNACNLKCPMCIRTTEMVRPNQLLDMKLLEVMKERGDFGGSAYVELQMAGEPTLHPQLAEVIDYMKREVGVLVGLSTHGLTLDKKDGAVTKALLELDALTISVDSTDEETYHKMRYPAHFKDLLRNLEYFFDRLRITACSVGHNVPFVELQLVVTDIVKGSGDVEALQKLLVERGWEGMCSIRTTGDCFITFQDRDTEPLPPNASLCTNPFGSVSVACNGDVVSCCYLFEFDKNSPNYYGNLYDNSLYEIWNGDRVKAMQLMHKTDKLEGMCAKCYLKSPMQIHQGIVSRLVRNRR